MYAAFAVDTGKNGVDRVVPASRAQFLSNS
jgi:hypothetical protein